MKTIPYILSFFLFTLPAFAQNSLVCDDGSPVQKSLSTTGGPIVNITAPGSLTSTFISNNGFAGNTFDVTPNTDLTITGLDFNGSNTTGLQYNIDLYYKVGTSVGAEADATQWTLLATGLSDPCAGLDLPTFVDLTSPNSPGVTLSAGVTYGLYFMSRDYSLGGSIRYTNGTGLNEVYSNSDLLLECKTGQGSPAFSGTTFTPRVWNGTIYYDAGPSVPTYTITNFVGGQTATMEVTNATPGAPVIFGYSLTGPGPTTTPYGVVDMSNPIKILTIITADSRGTATYLPTVPNFPGLTIYTQCLDRGTDTITNSIAPTIQ